MPLGRRPTSQGFSVDLQTTRLRPVSAPPSTPPRSRGDRASPPSAFELEGYVGAGAAVVGKLSFAGNLRLDGTFEGDLFGGDVLVIGPNARVKGRIGARWVVILGGTIEAEVTAQEGIEVRAGARVTGSLESPEIAIDPGALFSGRFQTAPPPPVEEAPASPFPQRSAD